MGKIVKKVVLNFLAIILTLNMLSAQAITGPADKQKASVDKLSEEQIAIIKENRAKQIQFRNRFKETLTGNQLDILTDRGLTNDERIRLFRSSLSGNQLNMIKSNRKQIRTQNYSLRSALSDQQRMRIRRMAIMRAQQNGVQFPRARMRNRFPR